MDESTRDLIKALVAKLLTENKATAGKRFSTYYEAQAHLVVAVSNATDNMKNATQALEFLWEKLKNEDFNEEYFNALNALHLYGLLAVEELARAVAYAEKLGEGVVHAPRGAE